MLFWIISTGLTVVAVFAVLLPLLRARRSGVPDSSHDVEVYRAQLGELERDIARGSIGAAEAETARAEIARRLIRADAERMESQSSEIAAGTAFTRAVGMAAVAVVPILAWAVYGLVGSPNMPDDPLTARLSQPPTQNSMSELVAKAERQLQAHPDDARGWDVLAPVYLSLGRYDDSVDAYKNAIRIDGSTLNRESGLGEALVAQSGGTVSNDARKAFETAIAIEPQDPRARFYLALAAAQDGHLKEAAAEWDKLAGEAPEGSDIGKIAARAAAAARAKENGGETAAAPAMPGPDTKDVKAAEKMSPGDRMAMIETMVADLDQKLRENPHDPEGWKRLIRSYMVLQKPGEAADALTRAIDALGENSSDAADIRNFAGSIGVKTE